MQNSFNSQEMTFLTHVVERACADLGACDETTRETIAARVIARASEGESNFDALLAAALGAIGKAEPNGA